MENRRKCNLCNAKVHRATMQKHLRSKKHLENGNQNVKIIPEWLFEEEQAPTKKQIKKVYNPKPLRQIAREKLR